jgi:hypothetical protein
MQTFVLISIQNNIITKTLNTLSNMILYKISNKILNNYIHKSNSLILTNSELNKYNIFNYKLDDKQIVIPIINISYDNLILYLQEYNEIYTLKNIYNIILLNQYFKDDNSKYLNILINNINNTTNIFNHKNYTNINNKFKSRLFAYNKIIVNIDYINNDIHNNTNIIDISSGYIINNDIINDNELHNIDIYNIFLLLNEKHKFYLYCNLLINENYSNNILNNYDLLKLMKDIIILHKPLFRYLLSYTWIKLYKDECINSINNNYIFDINTASLLPTFEIDYNNPKLNPYTPLLISNDLLNCKSNFLNSNDLLNCKSNFLGYNNINSNIICNQNEFNTRFNIFSSNNEYNNIFNDFNFIENDCYIVGSSLLACAQLNPIGLELTNNNINDYYNLYYSNSDIDIVFIETNIIKYIDKVNNLIDIIDKNIKIFNNINNSYIIKNIKKVICLIVSTKFISENISDNVKRIIKNINDENIIKKFEPYFDKLLKEYFKKFDKINEKLYYDLFDLSDAVYRIKIDDNIIKEKINISIKYNITSSYLNHPLEIFNTEKNIINLVSKFHLSCVRLYYDGLKVYLFPSCICALHTGMSLDYKYIYSTTSPMKILCSKKLLGFGTWVNQTERKNIVNYIFNDSYWNSNIINNKSIKYIYNIISNPITIKSKIITYKIDNNNTLDNDSYNNINYNEINNNLDKNNNKINNKFIDYNIFICININGDIEPVQTWIIDTTWNYYNMIKKY